MLLAMFSFVSVNAFFKTLDHSYPPFQVVFFRYFFAIFPAIFTAFMRGELSQLKVNNLRVHICRGAIGALSLFLLFQSLSLLPLAEAVTISFATSFFVTLFAYLLLSEKIQLLVGGALIVGFIGILIVAQPGGNFFKIGALYGIASALTEGFILVHSQLIASQNSSSAIAFYYALFAAIFAGTALPFIWVTPSGYDLLVLITLGVGGGIGQYFLIAATRLASAQVLAPLIYSQLLWSIIYSVILFDEIPDDSLYTGFGLIIAAGLVVIFKDKIIQIKQAN
ncbi:MAG: DMT family transporter [Candidatus Paracaedibacteraceae bacterium]|nr:DMT family transporter [Candidatus Paracaedibacteraceae bacterium]